MHKLVGERFNERKLNALKLKESLKKNSLLTKPPTVFNPVAYAKEFDRLEKENPLAMTSGPDGAPPIVAAPKSARDGIGSSGVSRPGSRGGSKTSSRKRGKRDDDSVLAPR